MAQKKFFAICGDDCKVETMTREEILQAIQQAVETGSVEEPAEAVISKIKEVKAGDAAQLWIGTEAEFNALGIQSARVTIRTNGDGVLYICEDDSTVPKIEEQLLRFFDYVYPVGSIYMTTQNVNPSQYFGGTWERVGKGRAIVGVDEGQTEFNTAEKTGGEKTHKLTVAEMPAHAHGQAAHSHRVLYTGTNACGDGSIYADFKDATEGGIIGATTLRAGDAGAAGTLQNRSTDGATDARTNALATDKQTPAITATGGNQPHNNLQPFYTCYIWKKTAGEPFYNAGLPNGDAVAY